MDGNIYTWSQGFKILHGGNLLILCYFVSFGCHLSPHTSCDVTWRTEKRSLWNRPREGVCLVARRRFQRARLHCHPADQWDIGSVGFAGGHRLRLGVLSVRQQTLRVSASTFWRWTRKLELLFRVTPSLQKQDFSFPPTLPTVISSHLLPAFSPLRYQSYFKFNLHLTFKKKCAWASSAFCSVCVVLNFLETRNEEMLNNLLYSSACKSSVMLFSPSEKCFHLQLIHVKEHTELFPCSQLVFRKHRVFFN